jgi:hypothetical protein
MFLGRGLFFARPFGLRPGPRIACFSLFRPSITLGTAASSPIRDWKSGLMNLRCTFRAAPTRSGNSRRSYDSSIVGDSMLARPEGLAATIVEAYKININKNIIVKFMTLPNRPYGLGGIRLDSIGKRFKSRAKGGGSRKNLAMRRVLV